MKYRVHIIYPDNCRIGYIDVEAKSKDEARALVQQSNKNIYIYRCVKI